MDATGQRRWVGAVVLLGAVYCVVGIASAQLAGGATSNQVRTMWRLTAFASSTIVFIAHVRYECLRRGNSPVVTAWHTSLAVALGAFALAAAALLHALASASGRPGLLAIALIAWPLLTGVPAFLVALGGAALLRRGKHRVA